MEATKEEVGLYNWYVDVIKLERKSYFLFTNSKTLFSFFVYAGTKKDKGNIVKIFTAQLKELIIREIGSAEKLRSNAFPKPPNYRFVKTNSRSVLGSMNDFKYQIEVLHRINGPLSKTHDIIHHMINKTPMSAINYDSPTQSMSKALESE